MPDPIMFSSMENITGCGLLNDISLANTNVYGLTYSNNLLTELD